MGAMVALFGCFIVRSTNTVGSLLVLDNFGPSFKTYRSVGGLYIISKLFLYRVDAIGISLSKNILICMSVLSTW